MSSNLQAGFTIPSAGGLNENDMTWRAGPIVDVLRPSEQETNATMLPSENETTVLS